MVRTSEDYRDQMRFSKNTTRHGRPGFVYELGRALLIQRVRVSRCVFTARAFFGSRHPCGADKPRVTWPRWRRLQAGRAGDYVSLCGLSAASTQRRQQSDAAALTFQLGRGTASQDVPSSSAEQCAVKRDRAVRQGGLLANPSLFRGVRSTGRAAGSGRRRPDVWPAVSVVGRSSAGPRVLPKRRCSSCSPRRGSRPWCSKVVSLRFQVQQCQRTRVTTAHMCFLRRLPSTAKPAHITPAPS